MKVAKRLSDLIWREYLIVGYIRAIGMPIKLGWVCLHVKGQLSALICDVNEAIDCFLGNLCHGHWYGFTRVTACLRHVVGEVALYGALTVGVPPQTI
ncbi:hypothetical protein D3C80_1548550 [compost metagenome]